MPTNFKPADTVIVCRAHQIKEAAVVLSCFPPGVLPPLLVMEPQPCTDDEYAALYESYRAMRNLRDEAVGTRAARGETREKESAGGWSNEEIDRRIEALTPFRLWVKRQRQISRLLSALTLKRAIFLFPATPRDMSVLEPLPIDHLSMVRHPLLADAVEWVTMLPESLGDGLAARAWQLIRSDLPIPPQRIETSGDRVSIVANLYRAVEAGIPLQIKDTTDAAKPVEIVRPADHSPSEAVFVEASEDAAILCAVQYALRQAATLCVMGTPDVAPIEKAREAIQSWQEERKSGSMLPLIEDLERSVSAATPDEAIRAVADLPLTAFTAGIPYHFLKKEGADWSRKPIGLMMGDQLLLSFAELFGQPPAAPARFNLLFDPGFFQTDETEGVMKGFRSSFTFPLLLQGEAASSNALIGVGPAPLELVYFNTHGSETAILLRDMPLPAYKLLQRITLTSQPVVFNNSCMSWTGVGREFVRAGARGYIGTLWSVNAETAAELAIEVTGKIVTARRPLAAALRETSVDPATEKAYVFVGPVCARLRASDSGGADERTRLREAVGILYELATHLCQHGPQPDSPFVSPAIGAFRQAAQNLCDEYDQRWPEMDIDRINLVVSQLDLAMLLPFDAENAKYAADLSIRALKVIDEVECKTKGHSEIRAAFFQRCSRVARKFGKVEQALMLLSRSAQEREKAGEPAGPEYLEISDGYRELGRINEAIEAAEFAQQAYTKPGAGNPLKGSVLAAGRLAQLWRLRGELDNAATAARDGFQAAVELDDLQEQATFKMDESRIHMMRGDYPAALAAAEEALKIVRHAHDDNLEVGAFGTLTRALIFTQDWKRATQVAEEGLNAATNRNLASEIADFQIDLSDIAAGQGDLLGALRRLTKAGEYLAITRKVDRTQNVLNKSGELLKKLDSWEAELEVLRLVTRVMPVFEREDASAVCTYIVRSILARINKAGWLGSREYLWQASDDMEQAIGQQKENAPEQLRFIRELIGACHDKSKGLQDQALATARKLDEMSLKGFQLEELFLRPADSYAKSTTP